MDGPSPSEIREREPLVLRRANESLFQLLV